MSTDRDQNATRKKAKAGAASDSAATQSDGGRPVDLAEARRHRFVQRLYNDHFRDLVRWLARRYGAGPPEPEDIAQTAFTRIAALEDVEYIRNPRAFLFTTAVNEALTRLRWIKRLRTFVEAELHEVGEEVEEITPERIYSSRNRLEAVLASAASLTDKQRELIRRSRLLGQTYADISADTGWSAADISRQLTVAMNTLVAALEAYDEDKEKNK